MSKKVRPELTWAQAQALEKLLSTRIFTDTTVDKLKERVGGNERDVMTLHRAWWALDDAIREVNNGRLR